MLTDKEIENILHKVDHTQLNVTAKWEDIASLCDDGIKYGCASVCIAPAYVKKAKEYVENKIKICTVIGFPNGYSTTDTKCFEASCAVRDGADEIDMVINIGMLKDKRYDDILDEIKRVKAACAGKLLKVIIETCLLSQEEKIKMCEIVSASGADFIKTSTGFSSGGATEEDITLFAKHVSNGLKIKAAGGITDFADAESMIASGASRLGTSRLVKILKTRSEDYHDLNTSY